ncbi:thioesterase II family protein [Clostridium sp. BJN0013]|mgnify:CR=1 FL=1|uniref:thioesterase II family protein n=1 Tax=Clostridium sp. BJN0013 TaxID=3236840 RepID=UPI0034C683D7
MDKIRLICLPYAGGSSMIYSKWTKYLNTSIEIYRVELAGRGRRKNVPLYTTLEDSVNDVFLSIKDFLNDSSYVIFGHSMGSIIAYELSCKIKQSGLNNPLNIIFSGSNAPHVKSKRELCYRLPEDKFKNIILEYGATPAEVFEDRVLASYFVPILRADFRILETYQYNDRENPFDCPITIFYGMRDKLVDVQKIDEWSGYTRKQCKKYAFQGGHFFINDNMKNVVETINHVIASL